MNTSSVGSHTASTKFKEAHRPYSDENVSMMEKTYALHKLILAPTYHGRYGYLPVDMWFRYQCGLIDTYVKEKSHMLTI